jgi:RNA polymerase sigma factor (TIGR02999 family)
MRAMRMILVDAYRAQGRAKRGGGARQVTLDEGMAVETHDDTLIELDEALSRLEAQDERKARILEMHYFGGLSYAEIAAETGLSEATVHRELRMAKAWLKSSMQPGGESG